MKPILSPSDWLFVGACIGVFILVVGSVIHWWTVEKDYKDHNKD